MTDQPAWGEGPSQLPSSPPVVSRARRVEDAATLDGPVLDPLADGEELDVPGLLAVVTGCIGLVVLGLVAGVVAGVLAAESGRRSREAGRPQRLALWGLGLAVADAVVWFVLHFAFDLDWLFG